MVLCQQNEVALYVSATVLQAVESLTVGSQSLTPFIREGPAEEGADHLSSFSAILHKAGKLYTENIQDGC